MMMSNFVFRDYGELRLPPLPVKRQRDSNGRFCKGCRPFNKGKKITEYLDKDGVERYIERVKINLQKVKFRSENAGNPKRPVIMVRNDGSWKYFSSISSVAAYLNVPSDRIRKVCKKNQSRQTNRQGKVAEYKCKGVRLYYEDDIIWFKKTKKEKGE